jgi:hypothetical protein
VIEPNPFYIQQANYLLNDIYDNGLMAEINRIFTFDTNRQILFNLNKFVTDKKRMSCALLTSSSSNKATGYKSNRVKSNSRSPIRIQLDKRSLSSASSQQRLRESSVEKSTGIQSNRYYNFPANPNRNQNENGDEDLERLDTDLNSAYHCQKEIRHHKSKFQNFEANKTRQPTNIKYFNDLTLQNSIIYYATSENALNGILFSPKQYDLNSQLFIRVFYNFTNSSFKIKTLMDHVMNLNAKNSSLLAQKPNENENFMHIEQGVLFNLLLNEEHLNAAKNKIEKPNMSPAEVAAHLKSKMREISFWVVGRRRLHRDNKNSKWISQGDFFICFHDEIDDILLELAFDVGFSKLAV